MPIVDVELVKQHGRAYCPRRGHTPDAKPEAQISDASFSHEKEKRPVKEPLFEFCIFLA